MAKALLPYILLLLGLYLLICGILYFFQERLIFFPERLNKDYQFSFDQVFEEYYIETADQVLLHGLLFKCRQPRGLVFYLHGNAGSLRMWGEVAPAYTDRQYDVFMLDYRGFGKSGGTITSQDQLYRDVQLVYDTLTSRYAEKQIIVLGFSIGTVLAARVASANNPRLLILQAPFYSLTEMMKQTYPFVPVFLLKYKFKTYQFIQACKMPVVIFHGDQDEVISYHSAAKLQDHLKPTDKFIKLKGQGHNGMTTNPAYLKEIEAILNP